MAIIKEIDNLDDALLDIYARYSESQLLHYYEPDGGLFIAESPKVIERALDKGLEPVSMLLEKKHVDTQAKDIIKKAGNIPVYVAEFDVLTKLTGYKLTRGALCAFKRPDVAPVEKLCEASRRIVILENVMNPTNVGAIMRSAAALNMDSVLLAPGCSDPYYRRACRVSMGTVFQIPWTYIPEGMWRKGCFDVLHSLEFKTVAMALCNDSLSIKDEAVNSEEKLAIILGAEGDGLSKDTIESCDYTVKIPMSHGVDSLNVAAASAVCFYQLG